MSNPRACEIGRDGGSGGDVEAASSKKGGIAAALAIVMRLAAQALAISTARSFSNSSSISALEMISGGDSAMMSPVVRISRPFS
jgi:hypothetical protein